MDWHFFYNYSLFAMSNNIDDDYLSVYYYYAISCLGLWFEAKI